jgi:hypothetical protein
VHIHEISDHDQQRPGRVVKQKTGCDLPCHDTSKKVESQQQGAVGRCQSPSHISSALWGLSLLSIRHSRDTIGDPNIVLLRRLHGA